MLSTRHIDEVVEADLGDIEQDCIALIHPWDAGMREFDDGRDLGTAREIGESIGAQLAWRRAVGRGGHRLLHIAIACDSSLVDDEYGEGFLAALGLMPDFGIARLCTLAAD